MKHPDKNTPQCNNGRQGLRVLPEKKEGERSLSDIFAELNGGTYDATTYQDSVAVPSINEDNDDVVIGNVGDNAPVKTDNQFSAMTALGVIIVVLLLIILISLLIA